VHRPGVAHRIAPISKPLASPTALLLAWNEGAPDALLALVYEELPRLAARYMKAEWTDQPLHATLKRDWSFAKLWLLRELSEANRG
jgi:hypothetical protein